MGHPLAMPCPPALTSAALVYAAVLCTPGGGQSDDVDFERDVRPILAASCHGCHGPDKQKAGLRLDLRAAALAGAYGGDVPVIVPGDAAASTLYGRVAGLLEDEDPMPPTGERLSADEVDVLRRWIDAGAPWPADGDVSEAHGGSSHWAYNAPVRPPLPPQADDPWCRDPLDAFVLARLRAEGLEPSPQAGRATLLRRVSLDLTGLPPTPEELDAFLADTSTDAYERAVERLLASPHHAEHLARGWLDLARYADTNGYEKDDRRTAWRYRDWVIEAFERDLPFDEFTILQLAGDLLPEPAADDLIATGFHRNTMTNLEGGVDPEEFRVNAVLDRVNTTASVWLGSTLACAQCHNHKYDPFSQREYFELFAFFNGTEDGGRSLEPTVRAPLPGQEQRLAELEEGVRALEDELAAPASAAELAELRTWTRAMRAGLADPPAWTALAVRDAGSLGAAAFEFAGDGRVLVGGEQAEREEYTLELAARDGRPLTVAALRLEALHEPGAVPEGPGRAGHGNFVLTDVELSSCTESRAAPLHAAHADHAQRGFPVELAIDDDPTSGWAVSDGTRARAATAVFVLEHPLELAPGETLCLRLAFGSPHTRHDLGRFRLSTCARAEGLEAAGLPGELRALLADDRRETPHPELLAHHRRHVSPRGRALVGRLRAAESERDAFAASIPTALVMREREEPRATHVFTRGSFLAPGEPVEPDVPAVLHAWPEDAPRNRLGLARWLVSADNPLTARVVVNRAWQRIFGRGLVATPDDFGSRGAAPTHPQLLDWLAVELVAGGWDHERLLRALVCSATYRQDARVSPALAERDPENLLLARGPRLRLEAEVLRDAALCASGLLASRVGGPSVFPPQPEGIWASTYSGDRWADSEGEDAHRRGLYTFHKRTAPYPSFAIFDAPSRELTCVRRDRTNTPLQALALLNDPVFVEAAAALAARVLSESGPSSAARIDHAFRLCLARPAEPAERELLLELLDAELARYRADEGAARALVAARPADAWHDPAEWAAWSVLASVLLNTSEFVTKG